jgi:lipopolysaccharide export system protein LptA
MTPPVRVGRTVRLQTPAASVVLLLMLGVASPSLAQTGRLPGEGGVSAANTSEPAATTNPPIEIEAEGGIEWEREPQIVIARGNAKAVRSDLTVTADVLKAFYRPRPDGTTEVWRMDGFGNVKIATPGETTWGDAATYDVTKELLIVTRDKTGPRVRMVTGQSEVTARDRLEYTRPTRVLVAVGDAVAVEPGRTVKGERLTAWLAEGGSGRSRFRQVDAEGNVDVTSGDERITADRGRFDGPTDTATFTGAVRVRRGDSFLDGCRADFDLRTGVNTLLPCTGTKGEPARVRGVIVPTSRQQ